jgi:hypothetical protein
MFRKLALALIAATALGTAAMTPTTASAWRLGGWHGYHGYHGWNRGWGYRHYGWRYRHYSWGYGRGWCYWHPYACSRY